MNSFGTYDSAIATDFVKSFEGRELKAYRCSAGVWTIGWGHTKGVKEGDTITASEAEQLLVEDLRAIADDLNRLVNVPVSEGQYIALLSLAFNVGATAVKKSKLLFKLNHGDVSGAASEFDDWVYANGRQVEGLVRRRAAEKALFLGK